MSAHTDLILSIITAQGPLEQSKKAVERELADLRAAGGFRENREHVLELNRRLTDIIKRLSILHKAEVLATKKALEEISGGTYQITLEDVQEVGGTDELDELNKLLSGLMSSRRGRKSRKNKSRKNKSRKSRN
jgi:hypothetical protein